MHHPLRRTIFLGCICTALYSCATFTPVKELQLVGFEEDVSKGKSVGQIEGGDCVYQVLGYWLGGQPNLSRAFTNAKKQRTSALLDTTGGDASVGDSVRYINNVTVKSEGFNAVVFGKNCLMVSGVGYK